MAWPRQPLPPDDSYTTVVRIRGGLDCSKYHRMYLKRMMQEAAQLAEDIDSAGVNTLNNTLLITSTSMDRIDAYLRVKSLTIAGKTHEVVVHPTSPKPKSCRIFDKLTRNPRCSTPAEWKVPFYVQYAHCWLRCTPFRQKMEACVKCKQIGHRPDVCPVVCIPTLSAALQAQEDPSSSKEEEIRKQEIKQGAERERTLTLKGKEHWPAVPTLSTSPSGPAHSQASPVVAPPPRNTTGPPPAKRRSSDEAEIPLDADAYMDLNDRITDLETKTGHRFLALEARITHLETRMTNIESKIDELKNMIATIIPPHSNTE
ncbi:hypothetical protein HPB49_000947 [Dermacentor silvarum]|uniref:Uncharacterized protein n=1 Tax=Dermacentor silvarum TaxID=543639 RepID=A0ACB8D9N2_DERSI|nr:hypothetical protein HPB49_000947 [Dermacentor silvarum]